MTPPPASRINLQRRQRPMSALRWILAGSVLQRVISMISIMLIVRLISHVEFGAYRQLLSIHLVFLVLLPLGMDQLLIREVEKRDDFLEPLWGALSLCSGGIAGVLLLGHPLLVFLMKLGPWDALAWLLPFIILVQGSKLWYKTLLVVRLDYRTVSIGETVYVIICNGIAVAAVLVWPNAAALYWTYFAAELCEFCYLRLRVRHPLPNLRRSIASFFRPFRENRKFCLFFCADQVLNNAGSQAPVLILGALAGKEYSAAYSLSNWIIMIPILLFIGAMARVAFPVLADMKPEALKRQILDILHCMAAFVAPILLYITVLAHPIVLLVLGRSYLETSVPIIQFISIFAIFITLFSPVSSLDILTNHIDIGFYWNLGTCIVRVAALFIGLHFGFLVAICLYAAASLVMWLTWGLILSWFVKMKPLEFHKPWLQMIPLWMILVLLLLPVSFLPSASFLPRIIQPFVTLALGGIPLLVYVGLLRWKFPTTFQIGMRFLNRKKPGIPPPPSDEAALSEERIPQ